MYNKKATPAQGYNGITKLYHFLKDLYDLKGLKKFVRHCPQYKTINLQTKTMSHVTLKFFKCQWICLNEFNLFNAYGLSLRPLAMAYAYVIGLGPRPLYIFP